MKTKLLTLLLILLALPAYAKEQYGSVIVSELVRVYDGDTFWVNIEGWPEIAGKNIAVRIRGIDTPEIRGSKCAKEKQAALQAKQHLYDILSGAQEIKLTEMHRGKYFRILSNVEVDGRNLAELLFKNGNARPYFGKTRKSWCY